MSPLTRRRRPSSIATGVVALTVLFATSPLAHSDGSDFTIEALQDGRAEIVSSESSGVQYRSTQTRVASQSAIEEGSEYGLHLLSSAGRMGVADLSLVTEDSPSALAVGHENGITISWTPESNVVEYEVVRDGNLIASVNGGHYIDSSAPVGEILQYQVNPVTVDDSFAVSHGLAVIRPDANGEISALADITAQAAGRFQSVVTWKSFIRQAYIDSPGGLICDYNKDYKFAGDNRGFNNGYPYRTMIQAVINWRNNGSLSYQKAVSPTKVYKKSTGALVATKTASAAKLTAKRLAQSTGTRVELYFTKHASNPFCMKMPNAIEGYLRIAVTRAGSYQVLTGKHLQMPAHEIYVSDQSRKTVYTKQELSAVCLQKLICSPANITGSGAYS